jgi:ketosteroid isomerase-like protein
MNIKQQLIGIGVLAMAAFVSPASILAQVDLADSIRSVRMVLDRQVADWNKGDLDGFLNGYWNSPKVVFQSGGQRHVGWNAMRERYRSRYQALGKAMGQLEFSKLELESLGPDSMLARGDWRLTMPDGTKPGGLFTVVLRRFSDGWKIAHDHTSSDETAPRKPSSATASP